MSVDVFRMEGYKPDNIAYQRKLRAQGLRAWRISATLWLCTVWFQGSLAWFVSQYGESKMITRADAKKFLALI